MITKNKPKYEKDEDYAERYPQEYARYIKKVHYYCTKCGEGPFELKDLIRCYSPMWEKDNNSNELKCPLENCDSHSFSIDILLK